MLLNNVDWIIHNSSHSASLTNSPIILSSESLFSIEYFYQLSKTTTIFKKTIFHGEGFVSNHNIYVQSSDGSVKKVFLFNDHKSVSICMVFLVCQNFSENLGKPHDSGSNSFNEVMI